MEIKNVKKNKSIWSVDVDGISIRVEIKLATVKLFIDNKLQDIGMTTLGCEHLTGKLSNGKEVKARVVGELKSHCYIFVDNELVLEI